MSKQFFTLFLFIFQCTAFSYYNFNSGDEFVIVDTSISDDWTIWSNSYEYSYIKIINKTNAGDSTHLKVYVIDTTYKTSMTDSAYLYIQDTFYLIFVKDSLVLVSYSANDSVVVLKIKEDFENYFNLPANTTQIGSYTTQSNQYPVSKSDYYYYLNNTVILYYFYEVGNHNFFSDKRELIEYNGATIIPENIIQNMSVLYQTKKYEKNCKKYEGNMFYVNGRIAKLPKSQKIYINIKNNLFIK